MNCKFKISLRAVALVIAVSFLLNVAMSIPKTLAKGNIIEIYNADDLMEQVVLSANGKTFECKLIGAKKASIPIVLDEDGSGILIRAFVFAGIRWWHYTEEFEFGFDSKYQLYQCIIQYE